MSRKRFPWEGVLLFLCGIYIVGWMIIPAIKYMINR